MKTHHISAEELTFKKIDEILSQGYKLALSENTVRRIQKCRDYLDEKMKNQEKPIYGVTTGFRIIVRPQHFERRPEHAPEKPRHVARLRYGRDGASGNRQADAVPQGAEPLVRQFRRAGAYRAAFDRFLQQRRASRSL